MKKKTHIKESFFRSLIKDAKNNLYGKAGESQMQFLNAWISELKAKDPGCEVDYFVDSHNTLSRYSI